MQSIQESNRRSLKAKVLNWNSNSSDEFTGRWSLKENKKDRTMEEVVLKTMAAFLHVFLLNHSE
jgi:hypothetical protein